MAEIQKVRPQLIGRPATARIDTRMPDMPNTFAPLAKGLSGFTSGMQKVANVFAREADRVGIADVNDRFNKLNKDMEQYIQNDLDKRDGAEAGGIVQDASDRFAQLRGKYAEGLSWEYLDMFNEMADKYDIHMNSRLSGMQSQRVRDFEVKTTGETLKFAEKAAVASGAVGEDLFNAFDQSYKAQYGRLTTKDTADAIEKDYNDGDGFLSIRNSDGSISKLKLTDKDTGVQGEISKERAKALVEGIRTKANAYQTARQQMLERVASSTLDDRLQKGDLPGALLVLNRVKAGDYGEVSRDTMAIISSAYERGAVALENQYIVSDCMEGIKTGAAYPFMQERMKSASQENPVGEVIREGEEFEHGAAYTYQDSEEEIRAAGLAQFNATLRYGGEMQDQAYYAQVASVKEQFKNDPKRRAAVLGMLEHEYEALKKEQKANLQADMVACVSNLSKKGFVTARTEVSLLPESPLKEELNTYLDKQEKAAKSTGKEQDTILNQTASDINRGWGWAGGVYFDNLDDPKKAGVYALARGLSLEQAQALAKHMEDKNDISDADIYAATIDYLKDSGVKDAAGLLAKHPEAMRAISYHVHKVHDPSEKLKDREKKELIRGECAAFFDSKVYGEQRGDLWAADIKNDNHWMPDTSDDRREYFVSPPGDLDELYYTREQLNLLYRAMMWRKLMRQGKAEEASRFAESGEAAVSDAELDDFARGVTGSANGHFDKKGRYFPYRAK